jgi:hypothetical protein
LQNIKIKTYPIANIIPSGERSNMTIFSYDQEKVRMTTLNTSNIFWEVPSIAIRQENEVEIIKIGKRKIIFIHR